jgi:hypothetical protein
MKDERYKQYEHLVESVIEADFDKYEEKILGAVLDEFHTAATASQQTAGATEAGGNTGPLQVRGGTIHE